IYKGRLFHVYQNLKHVPSTPIRQVEGQPLRILGSVLATVTICGQQISTPIYICPGMAASDGIIVGCHSLRRLGFSLYGPDGIDYLFNSDVADNLRIEQSSSFPAPKEMPFQGEESEERAPVQTRPNGRDLQSEYSLGEQETAQTQFSKAVVVRKQKKKSKKKKVKSRPPDKVEKTSKVGQQEDVGEGSEGEGHGGEGDATYVGGERQEEGVDRQESCLRCSVAKEQFVVSEAS
ncbi:MAG: hypothetical protein GY737_30085, partial [Desulfobacteraceae bacterium]|nr:hypothetical protein [Desulfobacteraceae bacterium]